MRHARKYLALVMVLGVCLTTLTACTQEEGEAVQLEIQLDPEEGDVYRMQTVMEQDVSQMIEGQDLTMEQTMGFILSFTVTEVEDSGAAWMDVVYDWILIEQSGPTGEVYYDSSEPSSEDSPTAMVFDALMGRGFSVKMASDGSIVEFEGVDEMLSGMLDDLGVTDPAMREQAEQQLQAQYSDEALMEQLGNMTIAFPKEPIEIGDTWSSVVVSAGQFPLFIESTYTLREVEGTIATLGIHSTISSDPEADPTDMGMFGAEYDLEGEQDAVTQVDIETGWTVSSVITQSISGEMVLTMESEAITVPMTIDTVMQIEMLDQE